MMQRAPGRGTLQHGNLQVDPALGRASVAGRVCRLSGRAGKVLVKLLQAAGEMVPRAALAMHPDDQPSAAALEVQVHRLRRLLREMGADVEIQTVLGIGYRLVPRTADAGTHSHSQAQLTIS